MKSMEIGVYTAVFKSGVENPRTLGYVISELPFNIHCGHALPPMRYSGTTAIQMFIATDRSRVDFPSKMKLVKIFS